MTNDHELLLALLEYDRQKLKRLRDACREALKYIPYAGDGNCEVKARMVLEKALEETK